MRPMCIYDPEDLNTLNKCCPEGTAYNKTHWEETKLLADAVGSLYSGPELLCDSCEEVDACACHRKKKCKKDDACDWDEDDGVCSAKTGAALKESVGAADEVPMQPNTAAIVPQAVTIMNLAAKVVGFVAAMWYGN